MITLGDMRWISLVLALALGCATAPQPPPATPAPKPAVAAEPSESAAMPPDYVEMRPAQVVGTGEGAALLLVDSASVLALPIFIGGTEAASIDGRMHGHAPPRPLTHDLLDAVLRRLHASLVKVQVDTLRDGVYIGSIYLRTDNRIIKLDARPSDAIALAIGDHAPIYVARSVLAEAALKWDDIQKQLQSQQGPES